jgi:hypothetical protein
MAYLLVLLAVFGIPISVTVEIEQGVLERWCKTRS